MSFHFPELHLDAGESAFISRSLEQMRSQTFDILFPELKGRSLVPVDNSVDPGAELIRYAQYESTGVAEMAKDYGEDAPSADIKSGELVHGVFGMKIKYGFSLQEMRNARLAGLPLDARKAQAARQAIEQKFDEIIFQGEGSTGLLGLANQPNTVTYTVPADGTSSSKLWTAKTPALILRDLFGIETSIRTATLDVESPDTLLLPMSSHALIATTPLGTTSFSDKTILQYFLANSLSIKTVQFTTRLETAGSSSTKRMVAYRKDPRKIQAIIPQEFSQLPPQARGYQIVTFCEARTGGVELYYPKSMAYGDGI